MSAKPIPLPEGIRRDLEAFASKVALDAPQCAFPLHVFVLDAGENVTILRWTDGQNIQVTATPVRDSPKPPFRAAAVAADGSGAGAIFEGELKHAGS